MSSLVIFGAMAAGFAATYALLLGGSDRSYAKSTPAAADGAPVGATPQQPGTPGGTEPPGGTETPGGTGTIDDPPLAGEEIPGGPTPTIYPAPTTEAPEPGTLFLLGSGAAALLATRLRRRPR